MDKPIKELLQRYKDLIKKDGLSAEKYKWEFLRDYKGKPNFDNDISEEIKSIKFTNLLYHLSVACLKDIAKESGTELIEEFKSLHDETVDLDERILVYKKNTLKLYRKHRNSKESHHQDERTAAALLTLKNPEEHTFYKSSYYSKYCEYLGLKVGKPNHKYSHYIELVSELAEDYISKDEELIQLAKGELGDLMNEDPNYLLIAQDILYQIIGNDRDVNYWIFQGNPKVFDFETALREKSLTDWTVSAHKDSIKIGDKVILWITGPQSGCYALAEVTSEPHEKTSSPDDHLWKEEDKSELKAGIIITHNLVDNPILNDTVKSIEKLSKLNVGHQGTNFSATKEQYEKLLEIIKEEIDLQKYLRKFDQKDLDVYFNFLDEIINKNNLKKGDQRLVFSFRKNRLNITIGQRYSWNLFSDENRGKFGVLSKNKIDDTSELFSGNKPIPWYTHLHSFNPSNVERQDIHDGITFELNRAPKSGFRKHNQKEFEEYVFNRTKTFNMKEAINTILYGPPGTGKTYKLKTEYFPQYTTSESSITSEKYLESVVKELTWWEVVALALLELKKGKVSEISDSKWVKKKADLSESKTVRPTLWGQLQSHTIEECEFVNVKSRQTPFIFTKTEDSKWEILEDEVKEQAPELYDILDSVNNFNPSPDKEIKRYVFTTFHQSYAYEEFIEGIKPVLGAEDESTELNYTIEPGVFKQLCKDAENDPEHRYAIFIDEINRGNVSNVFGELITLIEPDKRKGAENEMSATLPYSKKEFSVPNNLDIYGTMNTADRSVEALDTALRRRFSFIEMLPDHTVLATEEVSGVKLSAVLKKINERVEILVDRDHTIGHSYFIGVDTEQKLVDAFKDKIVPLLQEYFYGDYGKIGLVLGNGFVTKEKGKNDVFAGFEYDGQADFITDSYKLAPINKTNIVEAVTLLLNDKKAEA